MRIFKKEEMSNLRKKLLLYFLIIAAVSLSVSAEMILEFSNPHFQKQIIRNFEEQLARHTGADQAARFNESLDTRKLFLPLSQLRERILLLMVFIAAGVLVALSLFVREIVSPLEDIVIMTRKLSNGDLTAVAPVKTDDEIGQIARMLNSMNENLINLLVQLRYEMNHQTMEMEGFIDESYRAELEMIRNGFRETHCVKQTDFDEIIKREKNMVAVIERQLSRIKAVQKFIDSYRLSKNQDLEIK